MGGPILVLVPKLHNEIGVVGFFYKVGDVSTGVFQQIFPTNVAKVVGIVSTMSTTHSHCLETEKLSIHLNYNDLKEKTN